MKKLYENYIRESDAIFYLVTDQEGKIIEYNETVSVILSNQHITNITKIIEIFDLTIGDLVTTEELSFQTFSLHKLDMPSLIIKGKRYRDNGSLKYIGMNESISLSLIEKMNEINLELANMSREINKKNFDLKLKNEIITNIMYQDPMTKINNRRFLYEKFEELKKVFELGDINSLIMVITDIDSFKSINDTYGHDIGDEVLIEYANIITQYTRETDLKIRFGGDEFVIIFVDVDEKIAVDRLIQIKTKFSKLKVVNKEGHFTSSFGVSTYKAHESLGEFIKRADIALYQAKENGKNTYVLN